MGRWVWRFAATGLLLVGALLTGASAAAAEPAAWSLESSPNRGPGGVPLNNVVNAISCVSASDCMAVGYWIPSTAQAKTLVESWDGSKWSIVLSPNRSKTYNQLSGVSCASARDCVAVGYYVGSDGLRKTLIESWDGSRWSLVVPTPNKTGPSTLSYLTGVSCVSATRCIAVGGWDVNNSSIAGSLIESWNGTGWSRMAAPNPRGASLLNGVSCLTATACTAAGVYNNGRTMRTLVVSWNGANWSHVPSPNVGAGQNSFTGVSCVSGSACMAAGWYVSDTTGDRTLIESWNGTSWSVVPSPAPGPDPSDTAVLNAVSCASASACAVVGFVDDPRTSAVIEVWDGTSWSIVPTSGPSLVSNQLTGVSCPAGGLCTAAGFDYNRTHNEDRTLFLSGPT